ncbi:MAG: gamma-glutamyl-gamma-aminobutyrate hydrolase family protein [Candidatus Delongbacteria bacterium]
MRPVIAVSLERSSDPARQRPWRTGHRLDYLLTTYCELLESAGLQPLLVPVGADPARAGDLLGRVDGLLLSGGSDLDPGLWGEAELEPGGLVLPLTEDEFARSRWEDALVKQALAARLPLFGICRGMQQLNVSLGGSLWQDLERQAGRPGHPGCEDPFQLIHCVQGVLPGDELSRRLDGARVTSTHHQGLRRVAEGLEILATAAGEPEVVEAVRLRGASFALGVQWHPERMPQAPSTQALLEAFLDAVERRRSRP